MNLKTEQTRIWMILLITMSGFKFLICLCWKIQAQCANKCVENWRPLFWAVYFIFRFSFKIMCRERFNHCKFNFTDHMVIKVAVIVTWSSNFNWPFYLSSGLDGIVIIFYTWKLYWFNYYIMKKARTRIAIIAKPSFGLFTR